MRARWGIVNSCHWVLDMTFQEDDCRIRCGDGAQNFAILRRITLNLVKQDKLGKSSVRTKRLKAGWSIDYLQKLLGLRPLQGFMRWPWRHSQLSSTNCGKAY
ncbi:MAG: hypothetical protein NVS1B6_16360 [Steroidobacteraceae bacterium]